MNFRVASIGFIIILVVSGVILWVNSDLKKYPSFSKADIRKHIQKGMSKEELLTRIGQPSESYPDGMLVYKNHSIFQRTNPDIPKEFSVFLKDGKVDLHLFEH